LAGECRIAINKFNLLEVHYGYLREKGAAFADNILKVVENSDIHIFDILTNELFNCASSFKASYKVSLADSIALAQATVENAILITADHHEMDEIERDGKLNFLWVR